MGLIITCPICGDRNGYEFRYGGEDKGPPPEDLAADPDAWCDYVHMNRCVAGISREWWFHRDGCGAWFVISRDTARHRQVAPGPADAGSGGMGSTKAGPSSPGASGAGSRMSGTGPSVTMEASE